MIVNTSGYLKFAKQNNRYATNDESNVEIVYTILKYFSTKFSFISLKYVSHCSALKCIDFPLIKKDSKHISKDNPLVKTVFIVMMISKNTIFST